MSRRVIFNDDGANFDERFWRWRCVRLCVDKNIFAFELLVLIFFSLNSLSLIFVLGLFTAT